MISGKTFIINQKHPPHRVFVKTHVACTFLMLRVNISTFTQQCLPLQWTRAWERSSTTSRLQLESLHRGVVAGLVRDTRSWVGRIWCRSLKMKDVSSAPSPGILASLQQFSQSTSGLANSTLHAMNDLRPSGVDSMVTLSSVRVLYHCFSVSKPTL